MEIICLFMPGAISLLLDLYINKIDKFEFKVIFKYLGYVFLINLLTNTVVYFISSRIYTVYSADVFTFDFVFKYSWLAFVLSVIIPIALKVIKNNFDLSIEVYRKNSNEKKNNK